MSNEMPSTVRDELTRLLDHWDGELLSRSRLTDDLLDLRALVAGSAGAQAQVDRALGAMPGKNLVPREWAVGVVAEVAGAFGCLEFA